MKYLDKKEYVAPSMEEFVVKAPVLLAGSGEEPSSSGDYVPKDWDDEGGETI